METTATIKNFFVKLFENPVLLKELQITLRDKKIIGIQAFYTIVLSIISLIFVANNTPNYNPEAGADFFKVLTIAQWFLVVLISPSFTSSAISIEREKSTYDLLVLSLLTPGEIVMGKLLYACSYIFLLIISSLPLAGLTLLLGGVSPLDIIVNYAGLMLWTVLVSMLALFFSSRSVKSASASGQSYGILFLLGFTVMPMYIGLFWQSGLLINFSTQFPEILGWFLLYFNLLYAFLFLYYKTKNNFQPKAKNILALHRMFIIAFLINLAALLAIGLYQYQISSYHYYNKDDIGKIWAVIMGAILLFMGCFINPIKMPSKKEENAIKKALSSKPLFFPLFFGACATITSIVMISISAHVYENVSSLLTVLLFIGVFYIFSNKIHYIFTNLKPVSIYYSLILACTFIPMFLTPVMMAFSSDRNMPTLLIITNPIFSVISVWDPGMFNNLNTSPALLISFIVYSICYIFLRLIESSVKQAREKAAKNQSATTAG